MEDQSIKSLFAVAERKRKAIDEAYDRNSDSYRDNLAAAIATYERCKDLAERLQLFSPNESLEDIATGDLPYLQLNYHIADLYTRSNSGDRASSLSQARNAYERYLYLLDTYSILSKKHKKLYEEYTEAPTKFSTISNTNFEARRAAKIENFKAEKELKQKIDYISQNPLSLQNDDSTIRSLHLAQLALNTHLTFQALETLNREIEILALAPPPSATNAAPPSDLRERESRNPTPGFSDRLDNLSSLMARNNMSGPILDKSGRPLQVFTLLDKRQQFADGVFKSGHNLPTMTIDEYLEEERKRGGIIEGGGEASGVVTQVDEDDYDAGERETKKAREWDEYVEANPKGSGNTLNRG